MKRTTQYSAVNLAAEAGVDIVKGNTLPAQADVDRTIRALTEHGITVIPVQTGDEALAALRKIVPPGAEVMNGSSTTLIEIGYEEWVAGGNTGWKSLHTAITAENDDRKRNELRRKSVTADYFISGANAISRTGEIVACDASGSRVGAWPFAAGHLILVIGTNKIVPTLQDALDRVWNYAFRLENARAKKAYGIPSTIGKCVILAFEKIPGRVTVILVNEALGY
ncbi:lactate utilization protein [uncultured Methanoregula sp.]|uniref:lactate utilization protein n=1 Tax=uncultured Methanoregula sp. TaxID=1005933 RepID=UPI002AAB4E69|nr:lactate utilization protein [uncultured Methanoregula sp.]